MGPPVDRKKDQNKDGEAYKEKTKSSRSGARTRWVTATDRLGASDGPPISVSNQQTKWKVRVVPCETDFRQQCQPDEEKNWERKFFHLLQPAPMVDPFTFMFHYQELTR
jgi:hypothetical protein